MANSLDKKINDFIKSKKGQEKIAKAQSSAGVVSEEIETKIQAELINLLTKYATDTIVNTSGEQMNSAAIIPVLHTLHVVGKPTYNFKTNECTIEFEFDQDALSRESLYAGYDGAYNIVGLLNNGYEASRCVFKNITGEEAAKASRFSSSDKTRYKYVSLKMREGAHFMQSMKSDFEAKHSKDKAKVTLSRKYK